MAQLTAKLPRKIGFTAERYENVLPMKAGVKIFDGSLVGLSSGVARQLVAGDVFGGLATENRDNTNGADAALGQEVISDFELEVDVVGVSGVADVTAPVYASDGNTFTKTSTSNTQVGVIHRWISGTLCVIHCRAATLK